MLLLMMMKKIISRTYCHLLWSTSSASWPVRELASLRVGSPRVGVSASCPCFIRTPPLRRDGRTRCCLTRRLLCVVGRGGHVGVMFAIVWWRHCSRVSASMYRTSRQPVSIRYVTRRSTASQRRMQSCLETVRSNRTPLSPTNFVAPYSQNIWQDTHRRASLQVEKKQVRDGAPAPHLHPIGPPDLSVRHHCQLCGHRLWCHQSPCSCKARFSSCWLFIPAAVSHRNLCKWIPAN